MQMTISGHHLDITNEARAETATHAAEIAGLEAKGNATGDSAAA